jgi:uncharacterized membrane protein YfbV (UPF0208 family)
MKIEIRHVTPLRLANVMSLVYGCVMTVFAVLFLPFFLLMIRLSPNAPAGGIAPAIFTVIMLVLYPIIGLVAGWLMGMIGGAVYNVIVRWTGGVLMEWNELNEWGNPVSGVPPPPAQPAL